MKNISSVNRMLIAICAALMISAYFTPLWQISLWAPQYPEGLNMKIWIDRLSGDVDIINGVNHYIGMKHIGVEMFPEFTYLIYVFGFLIGFGFLAAIIGKRWSLYTFFAMIMLLGIGVLVDMYLWGYEYGHNLDPTAAIKVPGMSYQPPLVGYKELLNFLAYSGPDTGGWILAFAGSVMLFAVITEILKIKKEKKLGIENSMPILPIDQKNLNPNTMKTHLLLLISFLFLVACSTEPRAINYGEDVCHHCKMKLMDPHYGAQVVTKKGKIYTLDDVNCLMSFLESEEIKKQSIQHLLITDYENPENLTDATLAFYLKSEQFKTPMASQIVAFSDYETLKYYKAKNGGVYLAWGELITQFK